jgi:hypothetical protein
VTDQGEHIDDLSADGRHRQLVMSKVGCEIPDDAAGPFDRRRRGQISKTLKAEQARRAVAQSLCSSLK